MSFPENIILHLNRIIFLAFVLVLGSLVAKTLGTALVAALVGWLAFVLLLIFKHPPMMR